MQSTAQRLNNLLARAKAQWADVRGVASPEESKRRGAIMHKIIDAQDQPAAGTTVPAAEIDDLEAFPQLIENKMAGRSGHF